MWVCTIASLALAVLAFFTMPETYAPVLLARKTARLRKETGDESIKCARDLDRSGVSAMVRIYLFRPWCTSPFLHTLTLNPPKLTPII